MSGSLTPLSASLTNLQAMPKYNRQAFQAASSWITPQSRPLGDSFSPQSPSSIFSEQVITTRPNASPSQTEALSPFVLPRLAPQTGNRFLRILNFNDPHEKFTPFPNQIGAFRALSAQARNTGYDVLRLNAGDNNIGREPEEWDLSVRLMNMIGYHAVTMGNHELDLGSVNYAKGLANANFPTLLSNLQIQPGSAMGQQVQNGKIRVGPQIIRADGGGLYGLIGITTPDLKNVVSKRSALQGESALSFADTLKTVTAQVNFLKQQGINRIVVLSHMGYDLDQQLAKAVPGVDIIVGGHSHDVISGITPGKNYVTSATGEPVLIVQGGKNAQWMGVLDVLFDPAGRVIPQRNVLFNAYRFAPDVHAVAVRNGALGIGRKVAEISEPYDADGNEFKPDGVAQFTADAMRTASGADIAFVRSSEIRSNFEPGPLLDQDVKALMPFTDPVVRVSLTGEEIYKALSRSARAVAKGEHHPGMLHPSGLAFSLNRKTGTLGPVYVYNAQAKGWEHLNPKKTYQVALGEFTVVNQEFPEMAHPDRVQWNSKEPVRSFFMWGLNQAGALVKPIAFHDDGRLQIQ